jgi:hypothetical protein
MIYKNSGTDRYSKEFEANVMRLIFSHSKLVVERNAADSRGFRGTPAMPNYA